MGLTGEVDHGRALVSPFSSRQSSRSTVLGRLIFVIGYPKISVYQGTYLCGPAHRPARAKPLEHPMNDVSSSEKTDVNGIVPLGPVTAVRGSGIRINDLVHTTAVRGTGQNDLPMTELAVRTLLRARASRKSLFDENLFGDPAWDMLLELYAARLGDRPVSVSSLCIAADVPTTTALRWITVLFEGGWIVRQDDPNDGRRTFVHLTPKALAAIEEFFRRSGPQLGV